MCVRLPASLGNVPPLAVSTSPRPLGLKNTEVWTVTAGIAQGIASSLRHSAALLINVTAVNDAPEWRLPAHVGAVQEDTVTVISSIELVDQDVLLHADLRLQMSVSVAHGRLRPTEVDGLEFLVGSANADGGSELLAFIIAVGPLHALNRALAGLAYIPDKDWNSVHNTDGVAFDRISFVADNLGNAGPGRPLTSSAELHLDHVRGVNDTPELHIPGTTAVEAPCEGKLNANQTEAPRHAQLDPQNTPLAMTRQRCKSLLTIEPLFTVEDVPLHIGRVTVTGAG